MLHNSSTRLPILSKRGASLSRSFRRVLPIVSRYETKRHRQKRLEASRLNALAPIASLPPEILSHIFLFCVANCCEWNSDLGWLVVAQVTHQWRETALGCPELWANIVFRRKLAPIMLARSKMVPLVIRAVIDNNKHFEPRLVRANISRVGVLDVRGSQASLETFFLDYHDGVSATNLTSLSVTNTSNTTLDSPMWLDVRLFRGEESGGNRPSSQLRLDRCALPWNSPWYSNLTDLYLADLHNTQGPTITMLFSVLIGSPRLEHLTLINTNATPDAFATFFPVELCQLRTIELFEPVSVVGQILMNLKFPSIAKAVVSCLPNPTEKEIWTASSLVVHRDFCNKYESLRIENTTNTFLRISATSYWTDKTLDFDIYHPYPRLLVWPVLQSLERDSPCGFLFVTSLHLNLPYLDNESWGQLCQCRSLVVLSLQNTDPLAILYLLLERAMRCIGVSSLARPIDYLDTDGSCIQLLPKLDRLVLQEIKCGDRPYPACTDVLRALLWTRRAGRRPIRCVELERCSLLFKQDLDHLTFLAESFIWDGVGLNTKDKADVGLPDYRSFSLHVYQFLPWHLY
jgi:hypothetical protein